jgi:hypothetical protein
MTEPDENGNYTEQEWDRLPIAQRMRLCASGEYEIYPPDMIDAATRIEKLEEALLAIIVHCEVPAQPNAKALIMFVRKALEGKGD